MKTTSPDTVDALRELAIGAEKIAGAITPLTASPGHDATGGTVLSLTEAVMGVTAGLARIADAIESLADAVRSCGDE